MCYSWATRPSFGMKPRSPVHYNLITKSFTTKCLLYSSLSIGFPFVLFQFFVSVSYLVYIYIYLHDLSLRNRTRIGPARSLFVRSRFPFQPPSLVLLHTHIHLYLVYTPNLPRYIHTYICICIPMYKQALRGVDSDPDSRADKNSSQSIIRFMTMYLYNYVLCIVMYKKNFSRTARAARSPLSSFRSLSPRDVGPSRRLV